MDNNPAPPSGFEPEQPTPPAGFKPEEASTTPPPGFEPETPKDYGTTGQQVIAGLEGAAQGLAGPLAPLAETNLLGVPKEDIAGRAEANPMTHGAAEAGTFAASMLTGAGEAGLLAHGAETAAKMAGFGKLGSVMFKGALETAALQGSDEITKAVLGQGDPQDPVGSALLNIGGAGILGGVTGGVFNIIGRGAEKGLQTLENQKIGGRIQSFLQGIGAASQGLSDEDIMKNSFDAINPKDYDYAVSFYKDKGPEAFANWVIRAGAVEAIKNASGLAGLGGYGEAIGIEQLLQKPLEKLLKKPLVGAGKKYVFPILAKALANNKVQDIAGLLDYANSLQKGVQKTNAGLDAIFKAGGQQTLSNLMDGAEKDKDRIRRYVEEGGMNQQIQNTMNGTQNAPAGYAKGGEVSSPPQSEFPELFPTENVLMNSARGRVYGYLNSLRPQPPTGQLPFDKHIPSKTQEKAYDAALTVAARPLSVLRHVKDGTLTSDHVKHLNQMFPESYNYLSKKMTERMVKYGMEEENKPNFKTRQALSLFLATPLEKSFTPMAIQSAQAVFAPKPQPPAPGKMKKGTAKLGSKTNNLYQTETQESERDRSSRA